MRRRFLQPLCALQVGRACGSGAGRAEAEPERPPRPARKQIKCYFISHKNVQKNRWVGGVIIVY